MEVLLIIGLALLGVGICLWDSGRAGEKRLGVPVRDIVSADMGVAIPLKAGAGIKKKTLFSKKHRVTGRIDYLTDVQGALVPVEYKRGRPRQPRDSDGFQLLIYCFLLEEQGHAVQRGILLYDNNMAVIPYGPGERQEVLRVLAEMRQAEKLPLQDIPVVQDRRCRGCAYRTLPLCQ